MGVDLKIWIGTIQKYPLKYVFEGLSKPATTVVEAARADQQFCERRFDAEVKNYQSVECLDLWVDYCQSTDDVVDLADEDARYRWASDIVSDFSMDDMTDWDAEAEYILKEHPAVAVIDPASECAVPLAQVYYLCPGCSRAPVFKDRDGWNNRRHCGLCGAEANFSFNFQDVPFSTLLEEYMAALEIDRLPYEHSALLDTYVDRLREFGEGERVEADTVSEETRHALATKTYVVEGLYAYYRLDGGYYRFYITRERLQTFGGASC